MARCAVRAASSGAIRSTNRSSRANGELRPSVWMVLLQGHQMPSSALIPSPHEERMGRGLGIGEAWSAPTNPKPNTAADATPLPHPPRSFLAERGSRSKLRHLRLRYAPAFTGFRRGRAEAPSKGGSARPFLHDHA
jgi:hypothetical protein